MLPGVAGENYPTVVVLNEGQQVVHLLAADLAGFINHHDTTRDHPSFGQEFSYSLRVVEVLSQIEGLLALRGDDVNRQASVFQSIPDFPERMAFACAGAAAEQGDEIP